MVTREKSLTELSVPEDQAKLPSDMKSDVKNEATSRTASLALASRTQLLLNGPIARTLLKLAAPNIIVSTITISTSMLDAFFVGSLGSEALAGVSLVFPLLMLMTTMANGGMGGGVSSAIARALGAGRHDKACAVAVHSIVIAATLAAFFSAIFLLGGPILYRAMGGTGGTLEAALAYSNVVFSGAIAYWMLATLNSIIRGTGNTALPAYLSLGGFILQVSLAPAIIYGWGPFPRLGVAGAGIAAVTSAGVVCLVLTTYLLSGRGIVRPSLSGSGFRLELFWDILRVGLPGAGNTVITSVSQVLLTSMVGPFGTAAVAGYGLVVRLEYILIPLVFGLGSALVPMVGTNIGGGKVDRARAAAWVGAGLAATLTGTVGLVGALFPMAWLGLFSADPSVLEFGTTYLRIGGPFYAFFGLGLVLYFASQGAGRLTWPLLANFIRLVVSAGGGWMAINVLGSGAPGLFIAIALGFVIYGTTTATAIKVGTWHPEKR